MSQTPVLFTPSPLWPGRSSRKATLDEEAEERGVDIRILRSILGLRQDGSNDSEFVADAIQSHVQRKLNVRFHDRAGQVRWELFPYDWCDVTHKSPV